MSCGPKILHEWQFAGYCVRIAESEPGIVHFEQAKCEGELWEWKFKRTEKPMGDANEIIQLSLALRDVEAERDRLRKELEEATARGPHYIRDSRLRADGMRLAAEIARSLRPKDACTCGNYLSFRNGVPGHLPGCLVGECIEVADEIEGRAEEIDRSNRE